MALSKADKKMHAIRVIHNNQIAASILPQQIPHYEDAMHLATLEQVWPNKNTQLASPPFSKTTTQLLHNWQLATAATDAFAWAFCNASPDIPSALELFYYQNPFAHAAYYDISKIVLSHSYPEAGLQKSLCATLRSYTKEEAERLDMFCLFLRAGTESQRDRVKHGIENSMAGWELYEHEAWSAWGSSLHIVLDSWQWAHRVIRALVRDKTVEGTTLEMFLGIPVPNAVAT